MAGIQPWGCKVRVHDAGGLKLDACSKVGRWVGFDPDKDGHRIYWPEKQSVSVERSVKFNFNEEVVVRIPSFEGEVEDKSCDGNLKVVEPPGDGNSNIVEPQRVIEPPKADYGRGKRI